MKRKLFSFLTVLLLIVLSACGNEPADVSEEEKDASGETNSFSYLNPQLSPEMLQKTIDTIYEDCEVEMIAEPDETERAERFYLADELFEECYIRYCSNRYGLADLTVVKPAEEKKEDVWSSLEKRLEDRKKEFEKYDIYNSFAIAKAGEVVEIGDYLVMVIFEDNAPVKEALEKAILA